MSLFANYRADRLIAEVKSSGNPGSPLAQKALEKLVALGPNAIDPIVGALTTAEKRETLVYVEALSRLIDAKSLPHLLRTMADASGRAMSGIAWALSSSRNYPAAALLDALTKPGMPKQAIIDVIAAQKGRFNVRELLHAAYTQEASERSGLFKIIGEIADDSSIDDLISRIEGKDPVARLHIINVLGTLQHCRAFSRPSRSSSRTAASSFARRRSRRCRAWTVRSTWCRLVRHAARSGNGRAEQGRRR